MKNKIGYVLVFSYLLALITNLIPSIKYPDSNLSIINISVTFFFLIVLIIFSINNKFSRKFNIFLYCGILSGILIYVINTYEIIYIENIQYPFFVIFVTPLFGGNVLFDMKYETFSLLVSFTFLVIYVSKVISRKKVLQPQ